MYIGTTWELLSSDKYIKTGSAALQIGGSNSISIGKGNLPNVKLRVDSFNLTTQPHTHNVSTLHLKSQSNQNAGAGHVLLYNADTTTSSGGGQNTGTASPNTEALGSGTPLNIQPAYITLKLWKRLT